MNQKNETTSTSFKKDATSRTLPVSKRETGARPTKAHKKSLLSGAALLRSLFPAAFDSLADGFRADLADMPRRAAALRFERAAIRTLEHLSPLPF